MDDGYTRSVERAVRLNGLLRPYVPALVRLPQYAASLLPADVVALVGARVDEMPAVRGLQLRASTLVLRGYGAETALSLRKSLYEAFPDFSPERCMLLPRTALIDEYGTLFGQTLIDTLVDPSSQPALHALLFHPQACDHTLIVRRHAARTAFVVRARAPALGENKFQDEIAFGQWRWELQDMQHVAANEAAYLYETVTEGRRLQALTTMYIPPEFQYASPNEEAAP